MTEQLDLRVNKLRAREHAARTQLRKTQNARLWAAGLFFLTLLTATLRPEWRIEAPAVLIFALAFGVLVVRSNRLHRYAVRLGALASFYSRQSLRRKGLAVERNFEGALASLGDGADITLIQDLNLIGSHSLFTMLDETVSDGGRTTLARWITRPGLSRHEILTRQKQVAELSKERWFFIRLLIAATSESEIEVSTHQTLEFLKKRLVPEGFGKWVGGLVAIWLICVAGLLAAWIADVRPVPPSILATVFVASSLYVLNRVGPVFGKGVGLATHLGSLVALFRMLEARPHSRYRELMPRTYETKPSRQLKRFHFVLGFVSAESHPLVYLLLNAVLPWAAVFSWLLERERRRIHESFPACLEEFHRLEALLSLALAYHYQTQTFATLNEESNLEFKGLYHPLIPRAQVVANDFAFGNGKHLGLITGSNMSGKSTFLRTVGINQTLANMGAPCFAERMSTTVFDIASCIQVSDSLRDGFSYFYSEVLRLKRVIDDVRAGRQVLFLVDEIFRGTNNRERQIGSRAVIRSLVASPKSMGFVSTHDLELTSLETSTPGVLNLHFREDIHDGTMKFSYRLQPGPCPTTNALVIMKQAGLAVDALD